MLLTYISEHFTEKITPEEAGAVVHLNANYLSHLFSRSLGMTFSQYVKCKRISYASVLLLTTDAAIDEVACRSGFSSTSFLIMCSRSSTTCRPSLTGAGLASRAIEKANPKIRPNYEILQAKMRRIRPYAVRLVSRRSLSAIMAMNSELVGLPR